jgi:hypothetical protein
MRHIMVLRSSGAPAIFQSVHHGHFSFPFLDIAVRHAGVGEEHHLEAAAAGFAVLAAHIALDCLGHVTCLAAWRRMI